ncbi:hypothetical protein [Leisingera caerulea]|uniref:hypothetical protein n=1 Tax=Leisingera caerulea TaxID=506591 RepID=UPI001377EFBE|nr:hypothetical protein [Leisingera caerulea]
MNQILALLEHFPVLLRIVGIEDGPYAGRNRPAERGAVRGMYRFGAAGFAEPVMMPLLPANDVPGDAGCIEGINPHIDVGRRFQPRIREMEGNRGRVQPGNRILKILNRGRDPGRSGCHGQRNDRRHRCAEGRHRGQRNGLNEPSRTGR